MNRVWPISEPIWITIRSEEARAVFLILFIIALVVIYYVAHQIFYIACGVVGFLLAIIIYLLITRRRQK